MEVEIPIEAKDEAAYQKEQKKVTYTNIKNYIKERNVKSSIKKVTGMGPGTLAKLGKNQRVSLEARKNM